MYLVTCHIPDCANSEIGVQMSLVALDYDGNEYVASAVECGGGCGQQITDIVSA